MFIAAPDKSELRQGDIIAAVWFPRIRFEDIRLLAPVDSANLDQIVAVPHLVEDRGIDWTIAQIQMARRYVMVLSQCCDLEMLKGRPRGLAAVVSPLVPVPDMYRKKPEYLAALRENRVESYVNHFYVEQAPPQLRPIDRRRGGCRLQAGHPIHSASRGSGETGTRGRRSTGPRRERRQTRAAPESAARPRRVNAASAPTLLPSAGW